MGGMSTVVYHIDPRLYIYSPHRMKQLNCWQVPSQRPKQRHREPSIKDASDLAGWAQYGAACLGSREFSRFRETNTSCRLVYRH